MARSETPKSVRIRTDAEDGNAWRHDSIERASRFYGVNKSDAVAFACEDVSAIANAIEDVLALETLTVRQRKEIAELFDGAARGLDVDVKTEIDVSGDSNG